MQDNDLIFGGDFFDLEETLTPTTDKLQLREGELREVAVLFADIRGFSSISNLFDAETIHKKMDEIMKMFSKCISFYGGFVDKYMGDGIMALFGAKSASEQDTERAVLAAMKMQQQLKLYNALLNRQPGFEKVELGVRVGINTGLVSVGKVGEDREGDFTVYGPEVNLASRMESNAPVNRIMLPEKTSKLVSRSIAFEPAGPKTVKGFDEPIECFLVVGPKLEGSLHRRNHATRYIGRDEELGIMHQTLISKGESQPRIIGIKGEAGLGKTRLVYEFEEAHQQQVRFLHGACSAISPSPLNLFTSLFETLFRVQVNEPLEARKVHLEEAWQALEQDADADDILALNDIKVLIAFLLEIKTPDVRLKQSGADLLNILFSAIDVLINYIVKQTARQGQPLVMVLDDLHWIDEASERVLENLTGKFSRHPDAPDLLLVLMYRLDYQLPAYFAKLTQVQEISLKPLNAEQIEKLIAIHTGGVNLDKDTIATVIHLSEGNPFFLEEWCNYIEDLPSDELKNFPVPLSLHSLILSRLDKLPSELRLVLHKASVIGQEFFVEILKHIEGRLHDPTDIDSTLELLEQQSMVLRMLGFEYSSYFFKHITTREVAYQTILLENRKMLHQLCGEAIEELYPERREEFCYVLAEHFHKAGRQDKAIFYTEMAALSAARIYNNRQALQLYTNLLEILGDGEDEHRLAIRMKIADIKWLTGEWKESAEAAKAILEAAESIAADRISFEALRFLGIAAFYKGELEGAYQRFSQAMELATKLQDPLLICVATGNLGNWHYQKKEYGQSREMHQKSLATAEKLGDKQRMAKTLGNLGLIMLEESRYDEAVAMFQRSLELAEANRYLKERSTALGNIGYALILKGDMDSALPLLEQKLSLAGEMNDLLEQIKALGNIATIHIAKKDSAAAISSYQKIYRHRLYLGDEAAAARVLELISSLENQASPV